MEATRDTTPFLLSGAANIVVTAGVVAGAQLPSADLVNTLGVPVEISEIIVQEIVNGTGLGSGAAILPVEINLRAGRHGLTNGFIPTHALAPRREMTAERRVLLAAGATLQSLIARWPLPRPMILRAGEGFAGAVGLSSLFSYSGITATATVRVTARGRRMPPGSAPKSSSYPFVSGGYFAANAPRLPISDQLAFQNVFQVPLNVVSINVAPTYPTTNPLANLLSTAAITITGPSGVGKGARRTIATGPNLGVATQRKAIEEQFVLDPNESIRVVFDSMPNDAGVAATIMGFREEAA